MIERPSKLNILVCVQTTESTVTAKSSPVRARPGAAAHTADVVEVHADVPQDKSATVAVGVVSLVPKESPLTATKPPSVAAVLEARERLTTGAVCVQITDAKTHIEF